MMARSLAILALLLAALFVQAENAARQRSVEGTGFRLGYEPALTPLRINTMHSWVLTLETPEGEPIPDASILIRGGMPDHDHGLPTAPQVARELAGGRYVVGGMKFHMSGRWELVFEVASAAVQGTATVELTVPDG